VSKAFKSHGRIAVRNVGQVFISEIDGPWNVELTQEWIRVLGPCLAALARNGPMAGMAVFRTSMLLTPESLELTRRAARESARLFSIVAMAHVADRSVEGRNLMQPLLERDAEGLWPMRLFETFEPAFEWVQSILVEQKNLPT
jgi:hypothetical protein